MLQTGGQVKFQERPIEGLKFDSKNKPERLILDGQQRITSLYRALVHQEPVQTKDIRKKPVSGWFYIDIEAALEDDENREETIKFIPVDKNHQKGKLLKITQMSNLNIKTVFSHSIKYLIQTYGCKNIWSTGIMIGLPHKYFLISGTKSWRNS
jgi:uncharacterized protein with ParB-like and HNH nuclease domain